MSGWGGVGAEGDEEGGAVGGVVRSVRASRNKRELSSQYRISLQPKCRTLDGDQGKSGGDHTDVRGTRDRLHV